MECRSDPMDTTPGIVNHSSIRSKSGLAFRVVSGRFERFMQSVDELGGEDKATMGKIMEIINKNNNNNNEDINWISFEEVIRYMRLTSLLSSRSEVRLLPDPSPSPLSSSSSSSSSSLSAWKVDRLWRFKTVVTKLGGIGTATPETITEEMRNGNKVDEGVELKDVRSYLRALMPYFTRTNRGERLSDDGTRFNFRGLRSSRVIYTAPEGGPGARGGGYGPVRKGRRRRRGIDSSSGYRTVLHNLRDLTL